MPSDLLGGVRLPDLTYAPNIPSDLQKAVQDIIVQACPRFVTTAARDSAYAAYVAGGGSLADGRECYTEDAGTWVRHNSAWAGLYGLRAYGTATSAYSPTATTTAVALTGGTLQLTAYLKAGRAYRVENGARVWSTVAGDFANLSFRITPAAGTPAATDSLITAVSADTTASGGTNLYPLSARGSFQVATSGSYKITMWGVRSAGTGTLTIFPLPTGLFTSELWDVGIAVANLVSV